MSFTDRRKQLDDAVAEIAPRGAGEHVEFFGGEQRRQVVERYAVADVFRVHAVDFADFQQGKILFAFFGGSDGAVHGIAGAQAEQVDLGGRHVNIVGAGHVVVIGRAQESITVGHHFEGAFAVDDAVEFDVEAFDNRKDHRFRFRTRKAGGTPIVAGRGIGPDDGHVVVFF